MGSAKGLANGAAKLTDEQVQQIRDLHQPGPGGNTADLAAAFGVSRRYVTMLTQGLWRKTA